MKIESFSLFFSIHFCRKQHERNAVHWHVKKLNINSAVVLTRVFLRLMTKQREAVILPDKAFTVVGQFIKWRNNVFYCDSAPSEWRHIDKTLYFLFRTDKRAAWVHYRAESASSEISFYSST